MKILEMRWLWPAVRPRAKHRAASTLAADDTRPLEQADPAMYTLVRKFAATAQSPVSIDYLIRLGTQLSPQKALLFNQLLLRNELPIRLARRLLEVDGLPAGVRSAPSLQALRREHAQSFSEVASFPQCPELLGLLGRPLTGGEAPIPTIEVARALGRMPGRLDSALDSLSVATGAREGHLGMQEQFVTLLETVKHRHRTDILRIALGLAQHRSRCAVAGETPVDADRPELQRFLERFNRGRIGIRLLEGQHIALVRRFQQAAPAPDARAGRVGIIDPETDLGSVVESSAQAAQRVAQRAYARQLAGEAGAVPAVVIKYAFLNEHGAATGFAADSAEHPRLTFPYVPSILYHIVYELLKNSLRATMEREFVRRGLPTLAATAPLADEAAAPRSASPEPASQRWWHQFLGGGGIGASGRTNGRNPAAQAAGDAAPLAFAPIQIVVSVGREDMMIKVSDMGGGISRHNLERFGSFLNTSAAPPSIEHLEQLVHNFADPLAGDLVAPRGLATARDLLHAMPLCGLGYGIPISKLYAAYLGGCLEIVSMEGFGTDAYLYLRKVGDIVEDLRD